MKPRPLFTARLSFPLATAIAALLAAPAASALDYYWDSNGSTIGFAAASGTWLSPTPGPSQGWTTDSNGTAAIGSFTTATTDNLFFGSNAWALPSGAVTVSGTVNAGNLTFAGGTFIALSGGIINLASPSTIATNSFGNTTINSVLSGAGGMTRTGLGALILGGANDYTGATILSGQGLITISGATGGLTGTSGITFNGATLTLTNAAGQGAVDRLSNGTITSNGGVLNYGNANTAANTYTEAVGTLALTSGQFNTVLTTNISTAVSQTLTFGGLTRTGASNTSAVTFSANGTGPQAAGNKNMIVVSGAGTTATGQIIGPWATIGTGNTPIGQTDYAVYNADYIVPANIAASAETTWMTSTDAYTSSSSTALSANRTMNALRNTGASATITLSDGAAGYTLATNGILNGAGSLLTIAEGTVPGSVTAPGSSGGQIHMTAGNLAGSITVNAPINDNGGAVTLVKNGVGTLTLTSTGSNYSGGTVINSGTLNFANGTLGGGGITINGGSNAGATANPTFGKLQWATGNTQDISSSLTMVNGGNANLDTNGNNVAFANAVGSSSSSNLTKVGTGQLTFDANNTYTGETGAYAGTLLVNVAQTNTTSIRVGNGTANGGVAGAILRLGVNNALPTAAPVMVDGQSANTLDLNGFNQTIGHLSMGSNNGGSSGTVSGSGTLTLTAGATADGHNQGTTSYAGGLISVGFLDLNNATQNFNTVGATDSRVVLTISSVIQNGGVNKTGIGGQLRLSGDNTFSGNTTISGGVIRLDNSLAMKNSALDTTNSVAGGTLDGLRLNTGVTTVTLGGLIGNRNFAATGGVFSTNGGAGLTNQYNAVTALTLNPGAGKSHTYDGVIANGAAGMTLTKTGAGTQTLTKINTYTGATNVTVGTLSIDGTGTINTSSEVNINGGTFRYNSSTNLSPTVNFTSGTVAGTNWNGTLNNQTIGTGKTISPGNSPGTATTISQTWASGGSYLWEINDAAGTAGLEAAGWDLINGTGTLTLTATSGSPFNILVTSLTLANAAGLAANFNDATNYNWLIADFNSTITTFDADAFAFNTSNFTNPFTGTFGVARGDTVGGGDDTQIYLTYTAIPEPSAALLGGLGLLALLRRRRN